MVFETNLTLTNNAFNSLDPHCIARKLTKGWADVTVCEKLPVPNEFVINTLTNLKAMSIATPTTLVLLIFSVFLGGCRATIAGSNTTPDRLPPCPSSPNCVSSEFGESESHRVQPFTFVSSPEVAWKTLQAVITAAGGAIDEVTPSYLHASFRSKIFHFVDEVECRLVAGDNTIHIRSGARLGYYDFGVNRNRVEKLRQSFLAGQPGR
jgi:uncharacterized protein (DUF1499 family)